ncbi:hypothetical protein AWB74_01262 [Caballeronia arvi]|uniref:Uncharacterized protein n=1 Tax=Caballeronia arvi TaxID=1777135 RepID=A0A158G839_9BURK|nr:hypothetical protein [Caballeronia arvi]SAL28284.1 hypothetical protein AWB74_01262 [Caballeronia arvi]
MSRRKSFVISFDEASQALIVGTVSNSEIEKQLSAALTVSWPLDSLHRHLTDDTARRLGVTALSVLALYNPELRPLLKVTPLPMPHIPASDNDDDEAGN